MEKNMDYSNNNKMELLITKANELVSSIDNFSSNIRDGEIDSLSLRLQNAARTVPDRLSGSFSLTGKTDRIRTAIKIFEALSSCKDYLYLVEKLSVGQTGDLIKKIDDISNLLYDDYPGFAYAG